MALFHALATTPTHKAAALPTLGLNCILNLLEDPVCCGHMCVCYITVRDDAAELRCGIILVPVERMHVLDSDPVCHNRCVEAYSC